MMKGMKISAAVARAIKNALRHAPLFCSGETSNIDLSLSVKRIGVVLNRAVPDWRSRMSGEPLGINRYNNRSAVIIPQRQALSGLAAAKRQLNQQSWFWLWCNMRSPLLCSGSRQMAAANGAAVCPAVMIPCPRSGMASLPIKRRLPRERRAVGHKSV